LGVIDSMSISRRVSSKTFITGLNFASAVVVESTRRAGSLLR
jgi:hypothetical protein